MAGDGKLHLVCVNMGQGDCTLIRCPNGKTMMIDCGQAGWGDTSLGEVGGIVDEFLQYDPIDVLVMTHSDRDHYSAIAGVVGARPIGQIYHSNDASQYCLYSFRSWYWKDANVGAIDELTINEAHPGELELLDGTKGKGESCKIYALASNVKATSSQSEAWVVNTKSVVTMIEFGVDSVIVAGDATIDTEAFLIKQYKGQLKCHLLRVAHHGSTTSSSVAFIEQQAKPNVAVISVGRNNNFGLPNLPVIQRLEKCTDHTGNHSLFYYEGKGYPMETITSASQIAETGESGTLVFEFDGA